MRKYNFFTKIEFFQLQIVLYPYEFWHGQNARLAMTAYAWATYCQIFSWFEATFLTRFSSVHNIADRGSTRGGILRHYNQKSLHAGKIIPERRRIIYILLGMRFSTELMQLSQMSKLPCKMNFRSLYKYKSLYSLKYALASQLLAIKKKEAMWSKCYRRKMSYERTLYKL